MNSLAAVVDCDNQRTHELGKTGSGIGKKKGIRRVRRKEKRDQRLEAFRVSQTRILNASGIGAEWPPEGAAVCPPAGNPGEEMENQEQATNFPRFLGMECTGQLPTVVSGLRRSWQLSTASYSSFFK
jgi:hypothetical protein